jgi:hypothetical protein
MEKSVKKLVSIYPKDMVIIKEVLSSEYGEFSHFVQWCVRNESIVSSYKDRNKH